MWMISCMLRLLQIQVMESAYLLVGTMLQEKDFRMHLLTWIIHVVVIQGLMSVKMIGVDMLGSLSEGRSVAGSIYVREKRTEKGRRNGNERENVIENGSGKENGFWTDGRKREIESVNVDLKFGVNVDLTLGVNELHPEFLGKVLNGLVPP